MSVCVCVCVECRYAAIREKGCVRCYARKLGKSLATRRGKRARLGSFSSFSGFSVSLPDFVLFSLPS